MLDLGGTLLLEVSHEVEAVSSRIAEAAGLGGLVYDKVFKLFGLRSDVCESSLDAAAYYYAAALGRGRVDAAVLEGVRRELAEALIRSFTPAPAAVDVLEELRGWGARLGVISNASSHAVVEEVLKRHGLIKFLDVVVTSELVGVRKPDPRIFMYALALMQADPGRAVYVGDKSYEDVVGAKRAGMTAIHLARREPPSPLADAWISELSELPQALKNLSNQR